MILKEEIENDIKYSVIKYTSNNTLQKELIKALNIIHSSEYCKVYFFDDHIPIYHDYIYYKNGKIHNEFGFAIH